MSLQKIKSSGLSPEHSSQLVSDFEKVYFQRLTPGVIFIFLIFTIFLIGFSIVNLGKFLDITQEPIPLDVIVSLSGGGEYRIKKAQELYMKGYSKSDKIIFTGSSASTFYKKLKNGSYRQINNTSYLKKRGISPDNIIPTGNVYNTMQELLAVKALLLEHNMKSVLIVSDAPHSRRITFLANTVAGFNVLGLDIRVVSSDVPWWDRDYYYRNRIATSTVMFEIVKFPYNYIKYGILYDIFARYGISESIRSFLSTLEENLKYFLTKLLY